MIGSTQAVPAKLITQCTQAFMEVYHKQEVKNFLGLRDFYFFLQGLNDITQRKRACASDDILHLVKIHFGLTR